jgi:two-component system cell cycle response regulator DivK
MAHYPKRILIVEDNKFDVRLLKDILEWRGHETLETGDGLEAINLAFANLPDLILMDIQLPDISGLEVTRRLRGDDRSRRIPIVAVTAFAMGWHEREALDSGCDAYISKPIAILGFLRTVDSFLSRFPTSSPPASLTSGVPSPNTPVGLPVDTVPPKEPLSCREAQ